MAALAIDLDHPANRTVLAFLRVDGRPATLPADEVHPYGLGTHPDLVDRLWSLGEGARVCACALAGVAAPLLAEPTSGVLFGLAGGTGTLALRLPEPELAAALALPGHGTAVSYPTGPILAADIGPDWALLPPWDAANAARFAVARGYGASLARA